MVRPECVLLTPGDIPGSPRRLSPDSWNLRPECPTASSFPATTAAGVIRSSCRGVAAQIRSLPAGAGVNAWWRSIANRHRD